MRSWEKKDITDILIKHHEELSEASKQGVRFGTHPSNDQGSGELDDDCIVIEEFLESTFGIEWDGLKFRGEEGFIEAQVRKGNATIKKVCKFVNEKGNKIRVSVKRGYKDKKTGDKGMVRMRIAGPTSENEWIVTPKEASEIQRAMR